MTEQRKIVDYKFQPQSIPINLGRHKKLAKDRLEMHV